MRLVTNTYTEAQIRDHRREWIRALRSGLYKQAREVLHDGAGYCCLGVACDLAGITPDGSDTGERMFYVFDDEYLTLPLRGEDWLGVNTGSPSLAIPMLLRDREGNRLPRLVAELNDAGFTFDQIADLYEYFGFDEGDDVLTAGAE